MTLSPPRPLGVISIGVPYFGVPRAQAHLDATRSFLSAHYTLAGPATVVTDGVALDCALEELRRAGIAGLLLQIGTFPDGEAPARLADQLRVPIIVHSLPEPSLEHEVELNSLCGANLTTFTLSALEYPYTHLHGDPASPGVQRELAAQVRAVVTLAELKGLRIGMIGYRAPGFYPCVFDELLLRRQFGLIIEHVGLNEMTRALSEAEPRTAPCTNFGVIEGGVLSGPAIAAMERYYGALTSVLQRSGHRVIAIKDWPELFDLNSPGGFWPALGWAADDGYVIAPEGDVNGAITMALQASLSGNRPFFADVSAWDDASSTLTLWHYGGAPSLARDPGEVRYGQEGREVQFTLKPGLATLARLGLHRGALRLLAVAVEVEDCCVTIRRAGGRVRTLRTPAGEVIRQILDGGWEHHSSLVHGDILPELRALARLTGIPLLAL